MPKKRVLTERGQNIVRLAASGAPQELVDLFEEGTHHGKPGANQAEKMLAAEAILDACQGDDIALTRRVRELAAHPSPMAKQVACALMQELWPRELELTPLMLLLTTDEDWEVREWAAPAFTSLLSSAWPQHLGLIEELALHPHESVKRQIALAVKQTAQKKLPESIGPLLQLTELLLGAEHEYVRINLGPFCIGDGLLRIYPAEALPKLHQWARAESWPMRWNAVMSFSGAQGAVHPDDAFAMISLLLSDSHKEVQKAARKTLKNMRKRCPDDERFAELANV
ncbi:HEAT repeat protein [Tumebacillus sp. BK434]|uniref:DNA alkylation repair protein n=1 Tax=Tumebacillus sp. BK434 TaxID=2512169 RepID=UPI001050C0D2|nr:DNA alkylation repair protein [Tumebacillus sp. BK434]TCP59570.1 HEAT repeat protein [Tumebacillus sp. BK434]